MPNAPEKKFRIGYITANVWKNDGTDRPFYTVDVQRTYKDGDGNLQNTSSLNAADLLNAAFLLQKANNWILEQ